MTLLVHEILHLVVGLLLIFLLSLTGKRGVIFPWVLVSSLLTDLDHIVDYLQTIGPHWDALAFQTGSYFESSGRAILFLHSWEVAAILVIIGLVGSDTKYAVPLLGLGIGLLGHLFVDQFWYIQPWGHFFLSLRLLHGFTSARYW